MPCATEQMGMSDKDLLEYLLCQVCKTLPVHQMQSINYPKEYYKKGTLFNFYCDHLMHDLFHAKINKDDEKIKYIYSEAERLLIRIIDDRKYPYKYQEIN